MKDKEFENMTYEELVQLTLKEAKQIEETKKMRIIILAKKLENGATPIAMISQRITRDLQGYVNSKYVRDCLAQEYKHTKLVREQNTGRRRASTPAVEDKNLLVGISNTGNQETIVESALPKEQAVQETGMSDDNGSVEIRPLLAEIKNQQERIGYLEGKLREKSPEFSELSDRMRQLEGIEQERIKRNDFKSAASLPAENGLLLEIDKLRKRLRDQDELLTKNRFEADLLLKEETVPLIITINRSTGRAIVSTDEVRMKRRR